MQQLAANLRPFSVALIWALTASLGGSAGAQVPEPTEVAFPASDGGEIHGLLYGAGERGVVLAHGKVFDKESWAPVATRLAEAGLRVLSIDFRGYGASTAGKEGQQLFLDVIAGIRYLTSSGVTQVSIVGASMGGGAAARAAVTVDEGEIDRLVLLAPAAIRNPEKMHAGRITYLTAEGDPSMENTRMQYERAPQPKSLRILPGDAHAQHLLKTEHAEDLIDAVLAALTN